MMDDYTDDTATFGDRLAFAREQQNLSQQQLARGLGIKLGTVQNWEDDRSEPRANKVQMLAGFLNVSIVWLLTGQGEGAPQAGAAYQREPDGDVMRLVDEMRDIRLLQARLTERMGRIEKHLRAMAQDA